jgi:hypothetical protein
MRRPHIDTCLVLGIRCNRLKKSGIRTLACGTGCVCTAVTWPRTVPKLYQGSSLMRLIFCLRPESGNASKIAVITPYTSVVHRLANRETIVLGRLGWMPTSEADRIWTFTRARRIPSRPFAAGGPCRLGSITAAPSNAVCRCRSPGHRRHRDGLFAAWPFAAEAAE